MAELTIQTTSSQASFSLIGLNSLINGYPGADIDIGFNSANVEINPVEIAFNELTPFRIIESGINFTSLNVVPKYAIILEENFRNQIEPYNGTGSSSSSQANQFWS